MLLRLFLNTEMKVYIKGDITTIFFFFNKCNFCILHPISFILIPNESSLKSFPMVRFIVSIDLAGVGH